MPFFDSKLVKWSNGKLVNCTSKNDSPKFFLNGSKILGAKKVEWLNSLRYY